MKPQLTLAATGFALLAACADSGANYKPILDGTPTKAYQADLAACQALARNQNQFDQDTLAATALGAGVGAILGEADSNDALGGAVAGALAGGVSSAVDVSARRESIVIECLRGRCHRSWGEGAL
ncbi:MAG: glycine zipper family protein [Pseudomonadota bacterium]